MSAVVDFVEDTVGSIVEGVGDVFESVGEAISDVGDWIGENIIEPIKNDPLTFIATAVAYSFGIPGLEFAGAGTAAAAGIANTAANLAQGKDFDDSVKSGLTAFATTGLTNMAGDVVKGGDVLGSDNWYSSPPSGSAALPASQVSAMNTADDLANFDFNDPNTKGFPGGDQGAAGDIAGDMFKNNQAALSSDEMLKQMGEMTPAELNAAKTSSYTAPKPEFNITDSMSKANMPGANDLYKSSVPGLNASQNVAQNAVSNAQQPIYDIGKTITYDVPEITPAKDVGVSHYIDDYTNPDIPIEERSTSYMKGVDVETPLGTGVKNLAGAAAEQAGSWMWDGAKWVWNNPELALAGLYLGSELLGKKDQPPPPGGKPADQQARDTAFNASLPLYELDRDPTRSPFGGREQNVYGSDLYNYAIKGGEHEFYTPTTYTPVTYDANQTIKVAQGGPIGALNSQSPSYYRYGAMPMNMAQGGYASGGLRSVNQDGRSDHIPAMLSDGEYVIDAETVALLGNGSNKAGANRLESMRQDIRKQKGGALARGKFSPNAKSPLSYLKSRG